MNVVYKTSTAREDYKHQKGAGNVCCVCVTRVAFLSVQSGLFSG